MLSGEMPEPITGLARHAWIVAQLPGQPRMRWELEYTGHGTDPGTFGFFGDGEVALHGVKRGSPEEIAKIAECFDRSTTGYEKRHPTYIPIPGPNSNTIVAEALRDCGVHVELPATCIGRDYLGPAGVALTEGGTGVSAQTWLGGVRLGLLEGAEVNFVGLPLGVHIWPPGITLPSNPAGRIGLDFDAYRQQEQHSNFRFRREARELGNASAWLFAKAARLKEPSLAGGLEERVTLGLSGRGVLAKRTFGYAFGADMELGAGLPLGFAYLFHFYPVGFAASFGDTGYFGVFGGFGASGVTARVPGAFELPLEARLEFDVTSRARLGLRGAVIFVPDSDDRRRETVLSAFTRLGRTTYHSAATAAHGPYLAVERHEVMGTYWLALTLGTEIDVAQ